MMDLLDLYGRKFKTLRVSLLNTCNLGCIYCSMGSDEEIEFDHRPQKSAEELLRLISKLHDQLDLETIRLTGGEPLLYRELPELIQGIKQLGIPKLSMTSNGFLLQRKAQELKNAGLQSINVSLDAMDEQVFFRMSKRRQLHKVLSGIDEAIAVGIDVKLNAVIMKGANESEIIPLVEFAFERNVRIRFLEVMAMGHLHATSQSHMVSQEDILEKISLHYQFNRMDRKGSSTANYWQTDEGNIFGIIANESEPFCLDCNRLRLDSNGKIYGCLSVNEGILLNDDDDNEMLIKKLQSAMDQKQTFKFIGSEMSMLDIGG